ncbi:MAG: adenine phosphoribosyltransferase [Myxococcota bacterium]
MTDLDRLRSAIRDVPDFPRPGILFKDISPLLQDPRTLRLACEHLAAPYRALEISHVVGIESRGFIFGPAVALELGAGFSLARKPGKLPWQTQREVYELEYGTDAVEMHVDAVPEDARTLVVDDVIATGGTAAATAALIRRLGGRLVGCSFLIELGFLEGRKRLDGIRIESVLGY